MERDYLQKAWDYANTDNGRRNIRRGAYLTGFVTLAFAKQILEYSGSDVAANQANVGMFFLGFVAVADHIHGRRKDREEAEEKRLADIAAEQQRREDKQEDQRIERQENYSNLQKEFRAEQRWISSEMTTLKLALLRKELTTEQFLEERKEKYRTYYTNLISMFEESFIIFYKPENAEYTRFWNTWADYIKEKLADTDLVEELEELLEGEDPMFRAYMNQKIEELGLNQFQIKLPLWDAEPLPGQVFN